MQSRRLVVAAVAALAAAAAADPVGPTQPWGVHLAYGADGGRTSMSVMWSTREAPPGGGAEAVATAAAGGPPLHFAASSRLFSDANNSQWLHNATMRGLAPGTGYTYTVGAGGDVSAPRTFATQPPAAGGAWGGGRAYPAVAIYGDMGVATNAHKTLPLLYADVAAGRFDAVLHVGVRAARRGAWRAGRGGGRAKHPRHPPRTRAAPRRARSLARSQDIAYDLQTASGGNGDAFVVQTEPIAAVVPVHLCPGNHGAWRRACAGCGGGRESACSVFHRRSAPDPLLPSTTRGLLGFSAVSRALRHYARRRRGAQGAVRVPFL